MSTETIPVSSGTNLYTTTKWNEWWGWFGSWTWLSFMMYGYDIFILPDLANGEAVINYNPLFFMITFAFAILVFGFRFGRDPNGLSRIAFYTTPVAIIITAVFMVLPSPFDSVLYVLSPIFMAPALIRRVFGVLHITGKDKRLIGYTSAIATHLIAYYIWLTIGLQKEITFLIPSLLAIPAWFGIRRTIMFINEPQSTSTFKFSKRLLFIFICATILLFWLGTMNAVIYTHILTTGIETSDNLITILGVVLPGVGFLMYAKLSDKGYERTGLLISMMIFIFGILIALFYGNTQGPWIIPLAVLNGLGGSYFEFLILTIPIYFLDDSKRPVFTASLGVVGLLVFVAQLRNVDVWLPESLFIFGTPALFSTAFSAIVFVVIVLILFELCKEKNLVTVLLNLANSNSIGITTTTLSNHESLESDHIEPPDIAKPLNMMEELFTEDEMKIAMLLIEGETQRNISRKLNLNATEVTLQVNAIRDKVNSTNGIEPTIATIVREYKLTRRETDMLCRLRNKMTNSQIASELFLSEETVRIHIRNLLKKLPIESRHDVYAWVESFMENKE